MRRQSCRRPHATLPPFSGGRARTIPSLRCRSNGRAILWRANAKRNTPIVIGAVAVVIVVARIDAREVFKLRMRAFARAPKLLPAHTRARVCGECDDNGDYRYHFLSSLASGTFDMSARRRRVYTQKYKRPRRTPRSTCLSRALINRCSLRHVVISAARSSASCVHNRAASSSSSSSGDGGGGVDRDGSDDDDGGGGGDDDNRDGGGGGDDHRCARLLLRSRARSSHLATIESNASRWRRLLMPIDQSRARRSLLRHRRCTRPRAREKLSDARSLAFALPPPPPTLIVHTIWLPSARATPGNWRAQSRAPRPKQASKRERR